MAGFFNSTVLDMAIGLGFAYLLAIVCTSANEGIVAVVKFRSKMLKAGAA